MSKLLSLKNIIVELGGVGGSGVQSKDKPTTGHFDKGDEELRDALTKEAGTGQGSESDSQANFAAQSRLSQARPAGFDSNIRQKNPEYYRQMQQAAQHNPHTPKTNLQEPFSTYDPSKPTPADISDQNFVDPDDPDFEGANDPETYPKLAQIKPGRAGPGMNRPRAQRQTFAPGTFKLSPLDRAKQAIRGMPALKSLGTKNKNPIGSK